MNDEPPVCNPPHLETQIYSSFKFPFIQLNCSDKDSAQEQLSYSIVGGKTYMISSESLLCHLKGIHVRYFTMIEHMHEMLLNKNLRQ